MNPTGRFGIAGVFLRRGVRPRVEPEALGNLAIPWAELFRKDVSMGMGRDRDERYNVHLCYLIHRRPRQTQQRRLAPATAGRRADAFCRFDRREDGYVKVILDPAAASQLYEGGSS